MVEGVGTPGGVMRLCARISCVAEMNAVAPASDKLDTLIRRLSTDKDGEVIAGQRFERLVQRVHALGPRPLAEMLAEIAAATGQHVRVVGLVEEYAQLDPAVLRFLGGDKFPTAPLELVR